MLNSSGSLSLSSKVRCSSPLRIFMSFCWTLLATFVFLLHWGAPNWTQCSRYGLTSAERRGRITALHLLAMLCLMQPKIPLAFFAEGHTSMFMFKEVSTRTHCFFFFCQAALQLVGPLIWVQLNKR